MKFTCRQERFIEEYLLDGNGAQAAIRAGYSVKCAKEQAYRLLTYVHISAEIEKKQAEMARISGLSVHNVVQGLIDAVEQAKKKADAKTQISAWVQVAKILGCYPETTRSSRKSNIDPNNIQTWPDEMLREYLVQRETNEGII